MGNNGADWKSIAVSHRWVNLKDAALRHVLVSPYGIFEILMVGNLDERNPMPELRIGATGNTGSYAALNISTHPIDGLVGRRSVEGVNSELSRNGGIAIPSTTYGYLREGYFRAKSWIMISTISG